MARYITVSTLGPAPLVINQNLHPGIIVQAMKEHWTKELEQVLPDKPDLIVLHEACDRPGGFSKEKRLGYYKERGEQLLEYFKEKARENGCYIAYSAAREMTDGTWRNSTQIIDRSGNIAGVYNKNFTTIDETDDWGVLPGKDAPIIQCDFGRLACAICFDMNFDEIREKYAALKPDIIVFSSMYHGGLMANYWAYSCRTYLVGAISGIENYVISPVGSKIATNTNYFDFLVQRINLDYRVVHLGYNEEKLAAVKNKYGAKVKIADPGYLGAVLLTSETEEFTAGDVVEEFNIEVLDDYMKRSIAHRYKNMEK